MTDYTNIVNDLLSINDTMFAISTSNINIDKISIRMAFDKNWHNIAERAATAIEELQQIADHYEQTAKDYWKEACEYKAQLPKRGKWIWDDKRCIYVCSVCGSSKVRENMDRQIIKKQTYCYSCGAKMEVQDG